MPSIGDRKHPSPAEQHFNSSGKTQLALIQNRLLVPGGRNNFTCVITGLAYNDPIIVRW